MAAAVTMMHQKQQASQMIKSIMIGKSHERLFDEYLKSQAKYKAFLDNPQQMGKEPQTKESKEQEIYQHDAKIFKFIEPEVSD